MRCESPDRRFFAEVRDLNLEFLTLVADQRAGEAVWRLLGLAPRTAARLRGLSESERQFMATVPALLAGFSRSPAVLRVAEQTSLNGELEPGWLADATLFSTGLLTYLWQLARTDRLRIALCVGPGRGLRNDLRTIGFRDIRACAAQAVPDLRARHPRWWADLINAARSEDDELRERCRLDPIALSLAPLASAAKTPAAPTRHAAFGRSTPQPR